MTKMVKKPVENVRKMVEIAIGIQQEIVKNRKKLL